MAIAIRLNDTEATIELNKVFDYTVVNLFFEIVRDLSTTIKTVRIECSEVRHHDSSALGMLLFLQQTHPDLTLSLHGCNESLSRMLYIARLHDYFVINPAETESMLDEDVAA